MPWYVITCTSRREFSVRDELDERAISCMIPIEHTIRRVSRHAKRRELQSKPLLFGYVFIEVPSELPWYAIADIPGVRGFISQDGEPYALRPADVERLAAMSEVVAEDDAADRPLRPGDGAVIANGPFQGRVVKVMDIVGERARVLMELLGSMKAIEIHASKLEAAYPLSTALGACSGLP